MRERVLGYWALSWVGLIGNIIALPIIALIISYGPPLKVANITLAISLGWPAAIVGIVSSAALLAERKWGVTLTLVSLSMVISALNKLAKVPNELIEFSVKSVTEGIDALGEVTIRIRRDNKIYSGHSADTDVVVAAANAYVNALNRLVFSEKKNSIHPQLDNLEDSDKKFITNPAN